MTVRIALVSNTAWYIYNFRRGLIRELQQRGHAVVAIAPYDEHAEKLAKIGVSYRPLPMDNKGTNPLNDIALAIGLRRLLKQERPGCVLTFTVKPNVFGAFAAKSLGIPAIATVSGLGTAFIRRTWITAVVRTLYRHALRASASAFFQNPEDLSLFVQDRIADPSKARLLPGSGVDTRHFAPRPTAGPGPEKFRFLLLGRLLWDKGVREYVEAAARVKRSHPDCEFVLMGFTDTDNRTAVSLRTVREWEGAGLIRYTPPAADVRDDLASAHCVVLPSYREGAPKSLLEASSMGLPIITADVPGCRQVVEDGSTGFLVRARDAVDLAEKMERMLRLEPQQRAEMGRRGREKMMLEFEERIVVGRYMEAIYSATGLAPVTARSW